VTSATGSGGSTGGLGVATAALASFLTLLLERPLCAHVAEHNAGSVRVLEKCGFVAVDRVEIAGEPVTELLLRLDGSYDSATIA
jgi:RimJ/RimL family protein N-acetyltransferase